MASALFRQSSGNRSKVSQSYAYRTMNGCQVEQNPHILRMFRNSSSRCADVRNELCPLVLHWARRWCGQDEACNTDALGLNMRLGNPHANLAPKFAAPRNFATVATNPNHDSTTHPKNDEPTDRHHYRCRWRRQRQDTPTPTRLQGANPPGHRSVRLPAHTTELRIGTDNGLLTCGIAGACTPAWPRTRDSHML